MFLCVEVCRVIGDRPTFLRIVIQVFRMFPHLEGTVNSSLHDSALDRVVQSWKKLSERCLIDRLKRERCFKRRKSTMFLIA